MAAGFIANYPQINIGPPYQEGALFLFAEYKGIFGSYCMAMPVTNDMAMAAGREHLGFPKELVVPSGNGGRHLPV